jgi:hypothetical protein
MHPRRLLAAASAVFLCASAPAQELVIAPSHDYDYQPGGDAVVVIADLERNLWLPPLAYIAPTGLGQISIKAHGLTLFSASGAVASRISHGCGGSNGAIDILDTVAGLRTDTLQIPDYANDGFGTLAVDPAKSHLLVFSGCSGSKLFVVPAPFSSSSIVGEVPMPSNGGTAQTHAIAFDTVTGRAYVGHVAGISALDPPYTAIAFTITLPASAGFVRGRAVALSADGNFLASTANGDAKVQVLHAPFGAASAPTALSVAGAVQLDGLQFTPDGAQLLVVDDKSSFSLGAALATADDVSMAVPELVANSPATAASANGTAYAIAAPFDTNADVQTLDTGIAGDGFEDIDISADGQFAALSGGTEAANAPLVILRAPFTAAAVGVYPLSLPPLYGAYAGIGGRGTGSARFWSTPVAVLPQITTDTIVSATEGDSGTSPLKFNVHLSRAVAQSVTVDYATADGTLTAPDRYLATSGTLTFAPGETAKIVSVPIVGNTFPDGTGTLQLGFSNAVNASLLGVGANIFCYVVDNDSTFIITNPSPLPDGNVGRPYSLGFVTHGSPGGTSNWMFGGAFPPAGLALDPVTGVLSGTPAAMGVTRFTISVSDAGHTMTTVRSYQLTIGSDRIFADDFEVRP